MLKLPACEASCGTTGYIAIFPSAHKHASFEQKSAELQVALLQKPLF